MNETLKEENMTVSDLDISADKLTVTSEIDTADNDLVQSIIDIEPGENTFDLTVIEVDEDESETETKYLVTIDDMDNENMIASFTNSEIGET
ncbi:hypothetical protein ACM26V_15610 [Salipaludibacillus sp. HK11]|uniref:hypothetical protein n=1 Tax=Salipaludibacillus sp. HK11 TaxID=3394320 RepID=UPI0039FCDB16